MPVVLLGADLGTSGLKLVAHDPSGAVVAEAEADYAVEHPGPDRAETDVRVWRRALDDALGAVAGALTGSRVLALGLAGQMHGAVLVDARGAARADEVFRRHWGGSPDRVDRTGYLRGTVKDARAMVDQFRALGCTRLCIAFREGPYDWDALEAFAAEIVRAR